MTMKSLGGGFYMNPLTKNVYKKKKQLGGGFSFRKIGRFIKKVGNTAKKVGKTVKKIRNLPGIKQGLDIVAPGTVRRLESIGAGMGMRFRK